MKNYFALKRQDILANSQNRSSVLWVKTTSQVLALPKTWIKNNTFVLTKTCDTGVSTPSFYPSRHPVSCERQHVDCVSPLQLICPNHVPRMKKTSAHNVTRIVFETYIQAMKYNFASNISRELKSLFLWELHESLSGYARPLNVITLRLTSFGGQVWYYFV